MEQKTKARILDSYNAKGESLKTLQRLHKGKNDNVFLGNIVTQYTLSFYILFPVIVVFFLSLLFHHLIDNNQKTFFWHFRTKYEKEEIEIEEPQNYLNALVNMSVSTRNMYILISIVGSLSFVVYVVVLDCFALGYRLTQVKGEIFFNPNSRTEYDESRMKFEIEFSIPIIMLIYDLLILALITIIPLCKVYHRSLNNWYYFYLGPFSCIIVHSYHILVGFIQSPHHAFAVMIFYAIIVLVFVITYRAAYYNLVHCFKRYRERLLDETLKKNSTSVNSNTRLEEQKSDDDDTQKGTDRKGVIVKDEIQTVVGDDVKLKGTDRKGASVKDEIQPVVGDDVTLKGTDPKGASVKDKVANTDIIEKCPKFCCLCSCKISSVTRSYERFPIVIFLTLLLLSLLLSIIMVYVMTLFILIPINSAIDDAPERLFSQPDCHHTDWCLRDL